MRLIDVDAMISNENEAYKRSLVKTNGTEQAFLNLVAHLKINQMLELTPTIDAEPVVRCKECKYREYECSIVSRHSDNFYCAGGKKKERKT